MVDCDFCLGEEVNNRGPYFEVYGHNRGLCWDDTNGEVIELCGGCFAFLKKGGNRLYRIEDDKAIGYPKDDKPWLDFL